MPKGIAPVLNCLPVFDFCVLENLVCEHCLQTRLNYFDFINILVYIINK